MNMDSTWMWTEYVCLANTSQLVHLLTLPHVQCMSYYVISHIYHSSFIMDSSTWVWIFHVNPRFDTIRLIPLRLKTSGVNIWWLSSISNRLTGSVRGLRYWRQKILSLRYSYWLNTSVGNWLSWPSLIIGSLNQPMIDLQLVQEWFAKSANDWFAYIEGETR